ncbi:MAG: hypothetical protein ACREXY_17825 [Gammaproteobacteria bacterium]
MERHPEDAWIVTLNRAQGIQRQLERARATIAALSPSQQAGLPDLLEDAERVLEAAADGTGLGFAEQTTKDLWRKIHDHIADLPPADRAKFKTFATQPFHKTQSVVTDQASQLSSLAIFVPERFAHLLEAGGVTVAAIILLASIAGATVASRSYFPNSTFGTFPDYLGLFISGFGSTTTAGILVVLLFWRRTTKA